MSCRHGNTVNKEYNIQVYSKTRKNGICTKEQIEIINEENLYRKNARSQVGTEKPNPHARFWFGLEPGFIEVKGRDRNHWANLTTNVSRHYYCWPTCSWYCSCERQSLMSTQPRRQATGYSSGKWMSSSIILRRRRSLRVMNSVLTQFKRAKCHRAA